MSSKNENILILAGFITFIVSCIFNIASPLMSLGLMFGVITLKMFNAIDNYFEHRPKRRIK